MGSVCRFSQSMLPKLSERAVAYDTRSPFLDSTNDDNTTNVGEKVGDIDDMCPYGLCDINLWCPHA